MGFLMGFLGCLGLRSKVFSEFLGGVLVGF